MTEIADLISQVGKRDGSLGRWLQQQADNFNYALISRALKETSHEET
jgi:hypothetical protein